MILRRGLFALVVGAVTAGFSTLCLAQAPVKYEPTLDSLNRHPLPEWYAHAKVGIFVCWGPYSVPGWAPLSHPDHDFDSTGFIVNNPYAEWYYNVMRIDGSPTQAYHREHYGANYNYYNFVPIFDKEAAKWNPEEWARVFRHAGAKYVVLTSKFHDGFTLWPSATHNPTLPPGWQHATRDIVGELNTAVTREGMRMGVYYSGGFDWTFVPGPIRKAADYETVKPQSAAYGEYVIAQAHELIERYHPYLFWNDIDWPKSGNALQFEADYYNAIPDGVVDDRFGIAHSDFTTAEYRLIDKSLPKKWEENRGLGRSFGYNRAEGQAETIAPVDLIAMLVDVVSKNGNLLLDVGPEADGTIPQVQMERLKALGDWLDQNGEAIYDTEPWARAEGRSVEGDDLRFTRKGADLFVTLLGTPKARTLTIQALPRVDSVRASLLGDATPLTLKGAGESVSIVLPQKMRGEYAYVIKLEGYLKFNLQKVAP
jgi:alpha-L-fucosidase